jgi:hypothetical protein
MSINSGSDCLFIPSDSNYLIFNFVGTGLDVVWSAGSVATNSNANAYTVSVDGGTAVNWPTTGPVGYLTTRIATGLPYGTHTVKFQRNVANNWALGVKQFIVYGPKEPTLPSGATKLGQYYVMGNFVSQLVADASTISQGTVRKVLAVREAVYVGTWGGPNMGAFVPGGFAVSTSVASSYLEYSFFGTGFDLRINVGGTVTLSIDGTNPTAAGATSTNKYAGVTSFTASTGVIQTIAANGSGVMVSGLPLGSHKIRLTYNSGTTLEVSTIDFITPIHSPKSNLVADLQNTLPVGSQSIGDLRVLTKGIAKQKAWSQANGVSTDPSTSSTSYIPCPDMYTVIKTSAAFIEVNCSLSLGHSINGAWAQIKIFVDGVSVGTDKRTYINITPGGAQFVGNTAIVPVSVGVHKVDVYWLTGSGIVTATGTSRTLTVKEI